MQFINEHTFHDLFEAAPDATAILDQTGIIILVNIQAEKMFGYSREELQGKSIEFLLPDRFREKHEELRKNFLKQPTTRPMGIGLELYGRHASGREFPVEVSLSPLKTKDGVLITTAVRDISDRKKIEEELRLARESAESANRLKSEFLANMSHEIRTPLAGILGYAEMLIHYCQTEEERKAYGNKIKISADNLTELINDILDLSKVEAGALKVEEIPFSLRSEVDSIFSCLEIQAIEKQLTLSYELETSLPILIVSDPKRLRQILINILGNALKFTNSGSVRLKIGQLLPPRSQSPQLVFTVTDTGCGISPQAQKALFQPFVQADSSTTRKYGGTGLGLALSKKLARALGGDLYLEESTLNQGSRFVATISLKLPGENRSTRNLSSGNSSDTLPQLANLSILVVEDNPSMEELMEIFLTKAGAKVQAARNGVEAIALVHSEKFDVVLMDLQMPVMDGYEATKSLRQEGFERPIIAVTAHAMVEERQKCVQVGCTDVLTKPIDVAQLLTTIQKYTTKVLSP